MTRGACAGLLQPLRAELSNTADVLSCSVALELVEELSQGGPSTARAISQALSTELTSLLSAPDVLLRCQAIRVRRSTCPLLSWTAMTAAGLFFCSLCHVWHVLI